LINLKKYKIIDLSEKIVPGILKVNGEYVHGSHTRRFEMRQFIYAPDKTFMHWVETETHIGTHVEMPAHLLNGGKSSSDMPLESFMGDAIVLKFDFLKPLNGKGQPIKPEHLKKIRRDDIVLLWSPYSGDEMPYISPESAKWFTEKPVKMVGVQNVSVEAPGGLMATHNSLLRNDIPIIEGLINLDKLQRERVFYMGVPLRVVGLDSSWIRAVALEPI